MARRPKSQLTKDPLWYKDAVIYQLHVKSFFDANDDGIGDFAGLNAKLDYIDSLGVNTVWLLPFVPRPRKDDGYDIAGYHEVSADYGALAEFKDFVAAAHARGIRVISELVINHTSDQHPWFQRARKSPPTSAARKFYVWSDNDKRYAETRIIFIDTEKSNWTWDPVANAYFWHRFYSHQPDLNFDNPRVLKEVLGVMRFWLDMGVDGLRLDAIPYLIEREGTSSENLPETHTILKRIRAELDRRYEDKMLLAEANQWPEDVQLYFGDGANATSFHFPLMPRMYMAIAKDDRFPITDILRQTPDLSFYDEWAIFLRNHDQLTVEMVTDCRARLSRGTFTNPHTRAQLNLGIRRKSAPLLPARPAPDPATNGLLSSMPGAPVITTATRSAWATTCISAIGTAFARPCSGRKTATEGFPAPIPPAWCCRRSWTRSTATPRSTSRRRRETNTRFELDAAHAHPAAQPQGLRTGRFPVPLSEESAHPRISKGIRRRNGALRRQSRPHPTGGRARSRGLRWASPHRADWAVSVPPYRPAELPFDPPSLRLLLVRAPGLRRSSAELARRAARALPEFRTLVVRESLRELLGERHSATILHDLLPAYLQRRRWFAAKNEVISGVRIAYAAQVPGNREIMLTEIEVRLRDRSERYLVPANRVGRSGAATLAPTARDGEGEAGTANRLHHRRLFLRGLATRSHGVAARALCNPDDA